MLVDPPETLTSRPRITIFHGAASSPASPSRPASLSPFRIAPGPQGHFLAALPNLLAIVLMPGPRPYSVT
jgi:hypothetical protein